MAAIMEKTYETHNQSNFGRQLARFGTIWITLNKHVGPPRAPGTRMRCCFSILVGRRDDRTTALQKFRDPRLTGSLSTDGKSARSVSHPVCLFCFKLRPSRNPTRQLT